MLIREDATPVTIKHSFNLALERYREHLGTLVERSV